MCVNFYYELGCGPSAERHSCIILEGCLHWGKYGIPAVSWGSVKLLSPCFFYQILEHYPRNTNTHILSHILFPE